MLNAAGISFNDQWYSSQYLQFKIEMHFSSRYCYMLSSDQVYVTSQTKRYLTSIDRLCLRHALFRSHLPSLKPPAVIVCSDGVKPSRWENIIALFSFYSRWIHCPPIPFSVTLFLSFWSASSSFLQPNTGVWRPKSETTKTVLRFNV